MVAHAERIALHTERKQPAEAVILPIAEPFELGSGLAEEFKLHLLKFTYAEDEVARGDFVSEGFAHLSHAERDFAAGGALYILKVNEYALRGLRAEINLGLTVLGYALVGLEHHIEFAYRRKIALAAGTGYIVAYDIIVQLVVAHAVDLHFDAVRLVPRFDKLVGSVTHLAGAAVDKRIVEIDDMPGRDPDLAVH